MNQKLKLRFILFFTIGYILLFTVYSFINKNYEFIFYTIIMSLLIVFVVLYYKKVMLSPAILTGLSLGGLFHILGGNLYIKGVRLYDVWLIPNIFRWDNLVHSFMCLFIALVSYNLLKPVLEHHLKERRWVMGLVIVLIASGIGALAEIAELIAVVFLNAGPQVGDYFNNAVDLVFNLFGSTLAAVFVVFYDKYKKNND